MLIIDGSTGEGGGQILRTSLALSLCTGQPFRMTSIRSRRQKPGLMRQHLTAVRAAAEVGRAEVTGAELGSKELTFHPRKVEPGDYHFSIGTAGSATLVLQTVLPALLSASAPSTVLIEGGTHNPLAPPFDFLERAYLPLVARMGPKVGVELLAHGFYPAGGGKVRAHVEPSPLGRLDLLERGEVRRQSVVALVANLPSVIARRELDAVAALTGWDSSCFRPEVVKGSPGPGNVLTITLESEHVTEVFTGIGEKGVRAEVVGERVAREALAYLEAGVPVGEHLADQLVLPMALGAGGAFVTLAPSSHTRTHVDLLKQVLGVRIDIDAVSEHAHRIEVHRR